MEVRRMEPDDDEALAAWCAVLCASDTELWPDLTGFTLPDIRAFARQRGSYRRFDLLEADEAAGGPVLGVGMMELALRDNRHSAEVTIAVHPAHRRRGVGRAIVEYRLDGLRAIVAGARDAAAYRTLTFVTPWPNGVLEDHCELLRRMSTDEPTGDRDKEEEAWDGHRIRENDELLSARKARKIAAVAQHIASGRLVAFTEILLTLETPGQAWQLATLVHPDHRGHRLGLAVKIANLDFLAAQAPAVRLVVTGNAQENAPMIAINEMLGFEVAGVGTFWQKTLRSP